MHAKTTNNNDAVTKRQSKNWTVLLLSLVGTMFPNSNKYIVHISTNYSNFYFLYFISAGKLCNKETWSKALNFHENFEIIGHVA